MSKSNIKTLYSIILLLIITNVSASQNGLEGSISAQLLDNQVSPSNQVSVFEKNRQQAKLKQHPWLFLHPFKAQYTVHSDGSQLGSATRQMSYTNNIWKIQMSTSLKKWFISFKSNEYSRFEIINNKLLVKEFLTSTKLTFKKENKISQLFDWSKKVEVGRKGKRKWQLPLLEEIHDRMSHIIMLRADLINHKKNFDYLVSYKGKREIYSYMQTGNERLNTPMGDLNTIRMERKKGDDSSFAIWLCPELNYFPIKIAQYEQDKPDIILKLRNLEYKKNIAEQMVTN